MSPTTLPPDFVVQPGERLGSVLKKWIEKKKLKQSEVADRLNIGRSYLNRLLNDEQFSASGDIILGLARITGVPAEVWWAVQAGAKDARPTNGMAARNICESIFHEKGTSILVDHEIRFALENEYVRLTPLSEDAIQPASIDLTIGDMTLDRFPLVGSIENSSEDEIELMPGQTIYVETAEELELPARVVGHLGPMRKYTMGGLFLNCGPQIDPGWKGNIVVAIANLGKMSRVLQRGNPFLTVELCFLRSEPTSMKAKDVIMQQAMEAETPPTAFALTDRLGKIELAVVGVADTSVALMPRLDAIEKQMFGGSRAGTIQERIEALDKLITR